ncbi:MAG TPA: O-antigen ligase family protein, partial [Blastocatellia bacterium]|nr:O-antigen ligase family protein [Blastocatellia bacterium]
FLFYCAIRSGLRRELQRTALFLFLTLVGIWMSSRALYSFWLHCGRLRSLGFTDLTSFKHLYGLVGVDSYSTGERITVFLLLLPFPLALFARFQRLRSIRWLLLFPVITLLAALTATFLRGVYAAVLLFFLIADLLAWRYRIVPLKPLVKLHFVLGVFTLLMLAPVLKSVATTATILTTASQVRSVQGREETWRNSLEMVKRHPLFGIGAQNFPIHYSFYSEAHPTYVTSAYNYFLEVLIEKGVVGLAAYIGALFVFFWISFRVIRARKRHPNDTPVYRALFVVLIVAACCAVIVRDFTFSSLLINKGASALLWLGFASVANLE